MNEFEKAVDKFLSKVDYLGDEDLPMVVALRQTAKTLDSDGVQASLINQYRLIMKSLTERGSEQEDIDPLEELLK